MTRRFSFLKFSFILVFLYTQLTLMSCASLVTQQPDEGTTPDSNVSGSSDSSVAIFATDFTSSGQLYIASLIDDETALTNSGITNLGSSAQVRTDGDLIYILHDGYSTVSNDNLQIIDPNDSYTTLGQYSTGNSTNPHDVVVTGSRAFVALYNPAMDPDNVDANNNPADIIEIDTTTGEILHRYSFQSDLNQDGDLNGNAEQLILADNILYVLLQDLDSTTFAASSNGLIGMIDIDTNDVLGVIPLQGRNPVSFAINDDHTLLAVADMATYDFTLADFDTSAPYGGVEIVDLQTQTSMALLDDGDLGGFVERIKYSDGTFYAVVSDFDASSFTYTSTLLSAPETLADASDITVFDDSGTDIREIAVNNGYLWISRRQINTQSGATEPQIEVWNVNTMSRIGNVLEPVAAGMSMAGM